jgi:hydrogenase 3 maturation protease
VTPKNSLQRLTSELAGAERVAVLAVGSELHGDDAVGLLVGRRLDELGLPEIGVFIGATAPENCTGPIRRFSPTHLLLVDAADLGAEPGTVELLDPARLGGIAFTTHSLPLTVVVDYLLKSLPGCRVVVAGIQPASLDFGAELTPRVAAAVDSLVEAIRAALGTNAPGVGG